MKEQFITELNIPRSTTGITATQSLFKSVYSGLEYPAELLFPFEVAVEEGMTNLFEYAMDKNSKELLNIRFEFAEDEIRMIFNVKGRPINVDTLSKYNEDKASQNSDAEGLGLFLLQNLMDTVQWRYLEKKGQELFLAKKLPSPVDLEKRQDGDYIQTKNADIIDPENFDNSLISFRAVNDFEDAFALTNCAYDLYNYNYKDVIYYPNELLLRNKNHIMHSWIAADSKKNIYGHYAWIKKKPEDRIAEMGAAFVRPEYRKFGIFNELAKGLHEDAYKMGLTGLFALSVTNITTTQKHSELYGRYTVGLRVGSSPAIFVEGAKEGERVSTVLNYKQIIPRETKEVYIHPAYKDIVAGSYKVLNLEIEEKNTSAEIGHFDEYFDNYRETAWNRALISARGGEAIQMKLAAFTEVLLENGIVSIILSIDLEDPGAVELVETARRLGFFYSGIFPESFIDGHDVIQLQYLNNVKVNPAGIKIHQPSGKIIFDFIRNEAAHIFTNSVNEA